LHLASGEANPRFLLFTFTRAARDEIRDRLKTDANFKAVASHIEVTTLNSWGYRRLRSEKHSVKLMTSGKDKYFCIQNVLQPLWMKSARIKTQLEDSRRRTRAAKESFDLFDQLMTLGFRHDRIKNLDQFLEHVRWLEKWGMQAHVQALAKRLEDMDVIKVGEDRLQAVYKHFFKFWQKAMEHLFASAIVSLDGQKYWPCVQLDAKAAEGRKKTARSQYTHILVDEFQDINPLDLFLIKAIAKWNDARVAIIGDDDQAIYEWRGASPDFILHPDKHLEGPFDTVVLDTNYRSPKNIVEHSQRLIKHNHRRVEKNVTAASRTKARIEAVRMPNLSASVEYVAELVKELLDSDDCRNVAIIGRKRSQVIPYQIAFAGQDIPFYAAEDLHIFLSDAFNELKDILAIRARASMGGMFADPIQDVLKLCDKVKRYPLSKNDRESLLRHLHKEKPTNLVAAAQAIANYTGTLKGSNTGGRMSLSFAVAIATLLESESVSGAVESISSEFDGLQKDYGKSLEDIFYTDPPFLNLTEYAERYDDDFEAFYNDLQKAVGTLARIPPEDEEDHEQDWKLPLHLMTALRAKGKEFDTVIILDANRDIWPSKLAVEDYQLEQERRVFYVAMTRARKRLLFLVNETMLGEHVAPTPYLEEMGLPIKDA